ncbi:MAG: RNA polymerase sigma factor [Sedimentisphaerales bacterium]|nr:RNA polymerase sigma factor [Sedimentisphaerales bacterium]
MNKETTEIEDQLLVMDAQDGSTEAMEKLVRRWQERLWKYAFRLTSDNQAAWDVTQQSWLGIIKGLRKLHDPANFKPWAYRITTNKACNWIKQNRKEKYISLDDIQDREQKVQKDIGIRELLGKLDIKKQAVLNLYYFEQLNVSEISTALKIPKGTVKSRLANARNELKIIWQKTTR